MAKRSMICTVCPVGCHLEIDDDMNVTGNRCPRGEKYAKKEVLNPERNFASTVAIESKTTRRVPVKTESPVPKGKIFDCMDAINKTKIKAPVKVGDVVIENVCGTGVDIVATRSVET
ncbi:MAG: DUF1667 domain-containing protein [Bacillota bacterium]